MSDNILENFELIKISIDLKILILVLFEMIQMKQSFISSHLFLQNVVNYPLFLPQSSVD